MYLKRVQKDFCQLKIIAKDPILQIIEDINGSVFQLSKMFKL